MPRRDRPASALAIAAAVFLTGCASGVRPTLVAPPSTVSDPVTAAVLDRLERASTATFTATYDITPTVTGDATTATVIQSGPAQRVTIGTVEFTTDGTTARTCFSGDVECTEGTDEARVSDLSITSRFWGRSAAARLGRVAAQAIGAPTGTTETIAGQAATCASIPVPAPAGSPTDAPQVVYCAIDAGILARYVGADVTIELTSFTTEVDPAQLAG